MVSKKEEWPLSTTLCFSEDEKSDKLSKVFPDTQLQQNLYINPLCQILSKAFEIPKKTLGPQNCHWIKYDIYGLSKLKDKLYKNLQLQNQIDPSIIIAFQKINF